jgi:hypothetical protein
VLVIIAIFLLIFVCVMIWLYRETGGIPDTLVTCVFACCGSECGIMGWIQTTKTKLKDREDLIADRDHEEMKEKSLQKEAEREEEQNE